MMNDQEILLDFSENMLTIDYKEIMNELDILQEAEPVCSTPKANLKLLKKEVFSYNTQYNTSFSSATQNISENVDQNDIRKNMKSEESKTVAPSLGVRPQETQCKKIVHSQKQNKRKAESSNSELEIAPAEGYKKKTDFNRRHDVMNKTIMRAVKRFYQRIFKQQNPQFFKQRLVNVPYCKLHVALRAICAKLFRGSASSKLPSFLVYFLRLKKINSEGRGPRGNRNAKLMIDCMYKYTSNRFSGLDKIPEFTFLFNHIYDNFQEELFEGEENTLKKWRSGYQRRLDFIHNMLAGEKDETR